MNTVIDTTATRKRIAVRLLYTLFFLIVLEILKTIVQVTVVFQYVYLFIAQKYSQSLRTFTNKVVGYSYRVMRYLSLNENGLPFPFGDFPPDLEPPVERVDFK